MWFYICESLRYLRENKKHKNPELRRGFNQLYNSMRDLYQHHFQRRFQRGIMVCKIHVAATQRA